jgi:TRAP-type C4-dicarboxylate transport system permease small subunit
MPRFSQRIAQRISQRLAPRDGAKRPFIPDEIEDELLIVSVLGLIASLFLSLVARYARSDYHSLCIEAAAICLTWITTVGASRAAVRGAHVRVVLFTDRLPPRWRLRVELFSDFVMLLVAAGLFGIGCMLIRDSLANPAMRGHPLVYAAVPVGMGLGVYRLCQRLARTWRGS